MEITIDFEFRSLIPPLLQEEYSELEKSLLDEGCRDSLVVWKTVEDGEETHILIDGHNRYKICQKHNIPFLTYTMFFGSREDVKIWIIQNQLARRNLDNVQRSRLALKSKEIFAAKAKQNMSLGGGDRKSGLPKSVNPVEEINTQKELAKMAGVGHDTLYKVETVDKVAPEPIKQAMTDNVISINKAYTATKTLESMPEDKKSKAIEELKKANELPGKERVKAAAEIIGALPKEDHTALLNAFIGMDSPEEKALLKQRKEQQYMLGFINKIADAEFTDSEIESWLSDSDRDDIEFQIECLDDAMEVIKGLKEKALAYLENYKNLQIIRGGKS